MSTPIHAVHTIHGTFSGISTYSYPKHAGVVMDMPDTGLAKAAWRVVPVHIPPSCRRLSPPVDARRQSSQPVHFPQEDPFDDRHALPSTVHNQQLVPYQRTRLASQSFTVKLPRTSSHLEVLVRQRTAQRLAQDREARCRAVAGILLHRVHAVGKPMRRSPPNPDVPRTYKRSRLSTMVTVDEL
ncbi:hypothetical protein EV363DRAFT_1348116 [Boletus edulis]|uniref:Uncharacterized protein n=1 Tax=Boletus edulis BED1 TaxID=1328754 RepID=A0AAD4BRF8_BOLED|nr:hypothetical protein EV363DRAFT_1348116 [Boletus edulis]KAF8437499.1 hypothetical protein L210DRAFT_3545827 [Boletus edulis BED1]